MTPASSVSIRDGFQTFQRVRVFQYPSRHLSPDLGSASGKGMRVATLLVRIIIKSAHTPNVIGNPSSHRRRNPKRFVNPAKVVKSEPASDRFPWFSHFFENAFVRRVNRRLLMRVLRSERSTIYVQMGSVLGCPKSGTTCTDCTSAGLYPASPSCEAR